MANARTLKFDWLRGGKSSFPLPMGANTVIYMKSGKFVDLVGNVGPYGDLADEGSIFITGWAEVGPWNEDTGVASPTLWHASATAGVSIVNCIRDLTAVFRMPLGFLTATAVTNYAATFIGKMRDIFFGGAQIQYVDLTASADNFVIVVGGLASTVVAQVAPLLTDGYVDVMMNPAAALGDTA
jgi:hypothetical protein